MELVITPVDLEPLPKPRQEVIHNKPMGLLTSNYKAIAKQNLKASNANSIFGIKQRVKSSQYQTNCHAEAILKLSIFLILLSLVLA